MMRVLLKCETLPPEQLREACTSLVLIGSVIKRPPPPPELCRQVERLHGPQLGYDFDSCMAEFKTPDAEEACAFMIRDPDLARACKNVQLKDQEGQMLYIIYYQHYPEDEIHERHFTNKTEALTFYDRNSCHTIERCWMKEFELKEVK